MDMEKFLPKWRRSSVLLLSAILLGVFAYFGLKYYRGEGSTFPFFSGAAAWVEGKLVAVSGGTT